MTATTITRIEGRENATVGIIRAMLETHFKTRIENHINDELFVRDIQSATIARGAVSQLKSNRFAYLAYDENTNTIVCYDEFNTPDDVITRIKNGDVITWSREYFQNHKEGYSHITTSYIKGCIIDNKRYDGIALWNWGLRFEKTHGTLTDIKQKAEQLGCEIDGDAWREMLDMLSFDNLATKTSDHICDEIAYALAKTA